jgi:hypothetical protein
MTTAKQRAAAQIQALLEYRARGLGDQGIDQMIYNLKVKYGWLDNTTTVNVNTPAKRINVVYSYSKYGRAIPPRSTVW